MRKNVLNFPANLPCVTDMYGHPAEDDMPAFVPIPQLPVTPEREKFVDHLVGFTGVKQYRDFNTIRSFRAKEGDLIHFLAGFYVSGLLLPVRTCEDDFHILNDVSRRTGDNHRDSSRHRVFIYLEPEDLVFGERVGRSGNKGIRRRSCCRGLSLSCHERSNMRC